MPDDRVRTRMYLAARTHQGTLASKRTANVTGANYVIDGGLIKTT
jgi:hypothetical protein